MANEAPGSMPADAEVRALLLTSGGRPVIQIVVDPASDVTSIRSAGMDTAAIPAFLARLGSLLSGEG
jgi:hypothetical protein